MPLDSTSFDFSDAPPREEGAVRAIVLNSPFTPSDRQIIDVAWEEQKTVAEYLGDLDGNWLVVLGGREITLEERETTTATIDDTMVLVRIPKGDNGGILQIVLMIALVAFAAWAGPAAAGALGFMESGALTATGALVGKIITGAIIMIGGLLINALMPPPKAPTRNDSESSRSYGLDGAKATSAEDVPVPVVYGEFRVAGNRVNVYVENTADGLSQDFYAQYAVSEGPIDSITDFEINNQPVSAFQNVETAVQLGTVPQSALKWFNQAMVPFSDGRTVTETPLTYVTNTDVDKIRLDLVFSRGLLAVDPNSGDKYPHSVGFTASAKNNTTNVEYPIRVYQWVPVSLLPVPDSPGLGRTSLGATRIRVTMRVGYKALTGAGVFDPITGETTYPALPDSGKYNFTLYIRDADGNVILQRSEQDTIPAPSWNYVDTAGDNSGGAVASQGNNTRDFVYEVSGDGDPYFQLSVDNAAGATSVLEYAAIEVFRLSENMTITRAERAPVRVSFSTPDMPRGRYTVSIKRNNAQSNSDYVSDQVQLSDIYEITTDDVGYARTASYALKVRLTDQLNAEPAVTAKVRGRKVHIYDVNGQSSGRAWSNNPADIALDILLSSDWERRFSPSRIDFPGFVRWRAFCAANSLTFNGIFDSLTTVWDALMTVCRVGRANMVVVGTKWSVILEGPAEPVMMFGDHNIVAGSFSNEWVGRENRANRIEVQFYDKNDRNKRKSVYAVDEEALARNEPIRDTTINLIGVDNREQAQAEADLQLRINQRIVQACKFRAHLDALGCLPGDVVRVQHSMPAWGWSSRVKSVAGDQVTLENPLAPAGGAFEQPEAGPYDFLPEGNWRILVLRQATQRADATVAQVSGSLLTVNGVHSPETNPTLAYVRRVIVNGQDYRVLNATFLASQTVYALDRPVSASPGQLAQLWATEMIQQGTISRPRQWDTVVTTSGWPTAWPSAPIQPGDQVLIGRDTLLGKLFRIKSFGYDSNQDRQLELIEYDPWVYEPTGTVPVVDETELQVSPLHVVGLSAESFSRVADSGTTLYYARASWASPLNDQWGHAGAKVYVSRDFGDFALHEDVPIGRTESQIEARVGETVRFKVIAYATNGTPAPFSTAPITSTLIRLNIAPPSVPLTLEARPGPGQIAVYWTPPSDGMAVSHYILYQSETGPDFATVSINAIVNASFYIVTGLPAGEQRWFWLRAVGTSGNASALVGPVTATAEGAGLQEGEYPIELVDTLPTGLGPNDIGRTVFLRTTGKIYTWDGTQWVTGLYGQDVATLTINTSQLFGQLDSDLFPANLRPIEVFTNLPTGLGAADEGRIVYRATDDKLYRWTGTAWVQVGGASDVGQLAASNFPTSLRPIEVVSALPTTGNSAGRMVYLTTADSTSFPGTTFAAGKLYRWTGTAWTAEVSTSDLSGTLAASNFPSTLRPIEIVSTLPTGLGAAAEGRMVYLSTDDKLYRWTGTAWTTAVAATDISGTLADAQIAAVAASKITGQLTNAQLAALDAAKLTGSLAVDRFPSNLRPVEVVATLPTTGNFEGRTVYLSTDDKLYRHTGTAWTAAVPAADISGTLADAQIAAVAASKVTGQIAGTQISDGAISSPKIAAGAVVAGKIAAGSISATEIAAGAITAGKVAAGAITATEIAAGAITTDKIAAGSVTAGKVAANAITATEIATDAITAGKIAAAAVTTAKLAASAVTADTIAANAITTAKLAAGAVDAASIAAGAVSADKIAAAAVTAAKIDALSVTAEKIAASAITSDKIQAGAVSAAAIAAGTITADKIVMGDFVNRADNGSFASGPVAWGTYSGSTYAPMLPTGFALTAGNGYNNAGHHLAVNAGATNLVPAANANRFPVTPGDIYLLRASVQRVTTPSASLIVRVRFFNATHTEVPVAVTGSNQLTWTSTSSTSYSTQSLTSDAVVVPATAIWAQIEVTTGSSTALSGGSYRVGEVYVALRNRGELIVDGAITGTKIAATTITGDNIAAGTITGAKIAADTISTRQLLMGDFTNRAENPNFAAGADGWGTWTGATFGTALPAGVTLTSGSGYNGSGFHLAFGSTATAASVVSNANRFPVQPGETYYLRGVAQRVTTPAAGLIVRLRFFNASATEVAATGNTLTWTTSDSTSYLSKEATLPNVVVPAGAIWAQIEALPAGTLTGGSWRLGFVYATRRYGGELIVDGAISASKISAGAVGADKIDTGSIFARHFGSSLSTSVIWNSCLGLTTSAWYAESYGGVSGTASLSSQASDSTWGLFGDGSGQLTLAGVPNTAQGAVAHWSPGASGTPPVSWTRGIVATPGKRYQAQALLLPKNCSGRVTLVFRNSTGGVLLSSSSANVAASAAADGKAESSYTRAFVFETAPAGAALVEIQIVLVGAGFINPSLYFSKTFLAEATENATEPSPWGPGGATQIDGGLIRTNSIVANQIQTSTLVLGTTNITEDSITKTNATIYSSQYYSTVSLSSGGSPLVWNTLGEFVVDCTPFATRTIMISAELADEYLFGYPNTDGTDFQGYVRILVPGEGTLGKSHDTYAKSGTTSGINYIFVDLNKSRSGNVTFALQGAAVRFGGGGAKTVGFRNPTMVILEHKR